MKPHDRRIDKTSSVKNIVKSPGDLAHVIRAAIEVSSGSEVMKACLRGSVFFIEFIANLDKFAGAGPQVLAAYMLNVMMTCHGHLKDSRVMSVEILCWVGRDSHSVRTPMRVLGLLRKETGGKLERITEAIVREWVMDSVYRRVRDKR